MKRRSIEIDRCKKRRSGKAPPLIAASSSFKTKSDQNQPWPFGFKAVSAKARVAAAL
jgi:hypothetical protein